MRGTSGSEREVWEATVAARRSEARKGAEKLPAGVSRDRQPLFRQFLGSRGSRGEPTRVVVRCSAGSGNWPGRAAPAGRSLSARGVAGLIHLAGLSPLCGPCLCLERGKGV